MPKPAVRCVTTPAGHGSTCSGSSPTITPPRLPRAKPVAKPSVVAPGAVVKGVARWDLPRVGRLHGRGVYRVEFFVGGKLLWRDRVGPFSFGRGRGWDTRTVPNGRHLLTAKIYGHKGYRMLRRYPVRVNNKPVELALEGISPEGGARGEVTIDVVPSYPVERVVLTSTASRSVATAPRPTACTGTRRAPRRDRTS